MLAIRGLVLFLSCWLEGRRRYRSEFCEPSEVLGRGGEQELILGSVWAAQAQSTELQNAFEMGKQHLDFFAVATRLVEVGRVVKRPCDIASIFINVTRYAARRCCGTALRLQHAGVAIKLAGAKVQGSLLVHTTRCRQRLAVRTDIDVAIGMPLEVGP